jgi:hypothetical protein
LSFDAIILITFTYINFIADCIFSPSYLIGWKQQTLREWRAGGDDDRHNGVQQREKGK